MPTPAIDELVERVQGMKRGRGFTPYIDYIVFPRYRRIAPKQRIDFEFPLTVLVGRNGTGKSSVLQALYGAPEGKNVANYWFGTAVDPVERGEMEEVEEDEVGGGKKKLTQEQKAAFWYGYKDANVELQAIKQRVRRETAKAFEDQENWEPTRPNESYGMTPIPREGGRRGRNPQIKMDVGYLNLRYHLSAFDRCFHFWSITGQNRFQATKRWEKMGGKKKPKVQDYIRSRAMRLSRAFEGNGCYWIGPTKFAEKPVALTPDQLSLVSRIVGKDYRSGELLWHRLYDDAWAFSVRFTTANGQYTEANAGSGETSVVQIVKLFEEAKPNSLLLLDEPETSLHPGAQRELLHYILTQITKKKLQVVLSTHAPTLVKGLPREAIKVMRRLPAGTIAVEQGLSAEEAFYEIGQPFEATCNVIVEDRLAKLALDEVAKAKGDGFAAKVRVEYRPGGDSEMKKDIAVFMHSHHRPVLIFDGDKVTRHTNPGAIRDGQKTAGLLDAVIGRQTGTTVKFHQDSNMTAQQKAQLRVEYLTYYHERVFYLPFQSPEAGMWDDSVADNLLHAILPPARANAAKATIAAEPDFKLKFDLLSRSLGHGAMHPTQVHAMFVTRFVEARGAGFDALAALLQQAVDAAEAKDA